MNIINNQCIIAQIALSTLQPEKQSQDDTMLFIPLDLTSFENQSVASTLAVYLAEENEVDYTTIAEIESQINYSLCVDSMDNNPTWFLSVSIDDYCASFKVLFDEGEQQNLYWGLVQNSMYENIPVGGVSE